MSRPTTSAPLRLAPGFAHTLLVDTNGTLSCWSGSISPNVGGEFGLGHVHPVARYARLAVPNLKGVVAAGAGYDCSFAVLADGRLLSWGLKAMLGITPLSELEKNPIPRPGTSVPTPVATAFEATDISVGARHVLALARSGDVYAWGDGSGGRLGVGSLPVINFTSMPPGMINDLPFPVRVPPFGRVVALSAGLDHSLALMDDGTLRAWGRNTHGQIGDGTLLNRGVPVAVSGIRNAVSIAAGASFSIAALADGRVMAWGTDLDGALGHVTGSTTGAANPTPALVDSVNSVRAVSAGNGHVLALTNGGTVITWGRHARGQTGQGNEQPGDDARTPRLLGELSNVLSVVANRDLSYALLQNGTIMIWGRPVPEWTTPDGHISDLSRVPKQLELTPG